MGISIPFLQTQEVLKMFKNSKFLKGVFLAMAGVLVLAFGLLNIVVAFMEVTVLRGV